MSSKDEAETVLSTGKGASGSTLGTLIGNYIINFMVSGAMEQVWSLLNSLQVVRNFCLLDTKTPGNVLNFINVFEGISNVELWDFEEVIRDYYYIPEQEPFSLNFLSFGIKTTLFYINASNWLFFLTLILSFHLLMILLMGVFGFCSAMATRQRKIAQYRLFWGGTIRLYMEAYLEITLMSILNLYMSDLSHGMAIVNISDCQSYIAITLSAMLPPLLFLYVLKNKTKIDEPVFKARYGSFWDGTKSDSGKFFKISLTVPMAFFARRAILSMTVIFLSKHFWA